MSMVASPTLQLTAIPVPGKFKSSRTEECFVDGIDALEHEGIHKVRVVSDELALPLAPLLLGCKVSLRVRVRVIRVRVRVSVQVNK